MRPCPYPIAELLPHAPPAILLDRVTGWEPSRLEALLVIRRNGSFFTPGRGVPSHVGIEYMAQACGAYAGIEAKTAGLPVRIGFLLGTRGYVSSLRWFAAGSTLTVSVVEVLREGGMAVFDCAIAQDGSQVATARLTLYQSDDALAARRQQDALP